MVRHGLSRIRRQAGRERHPGELAGKITASLAQASGDGANPHPPHVLDAIVELSGSGEKLVFGPRTVTPNGAGALLTHLGEHGLGKRSKAALPLKMALGGGHLHAGHLAQLADFTRNPRAWKKILEKMGQFPKEPKQFAAKMKELLTESQIEAGNDEENGAGKIGEGDRKEKDLREKIAAMLKRTVGNNAKRHARLAADRELSLDEISDAIRRKTGGDGGFEADLTRHFAGQDMSGPEKVASEFRKFLARRTTG